ncbi:hypothetical protein ACFQZI_12685 [Mucilaginibacter lutimaris]|uniref:DUF4177 domain-containing protein n=1 Tax=Mucilaginibacter lutimaris TaxID=931629 RepID=A0ABW2ZHN2_9SPHI
MKYYRFLNCIALEQVQNLINEYAHEGWIVKAFNIVAENENNQDKWAYILFEADVEE